MPERARGEHRRTPAENLAWMRERFGIGDPPKVPDTVARLAADFPDDPLEHLEEARAAVAEAEANGTRLTFGTKVYRPSA